MDQEGNTIEESSSVHSYEAELWTLKERSHGNLWKDCQNRDGGTRVSTKVPDEFGRHTVIPVPTCNTAGTGAVCPQVWKCGPTPAPVIPVCSIPQVDPYPRYTLSTCHHCCEPLLTVWIAGANNYWQRGDNDNNDDRGMTMASATMKDHNNVWWQPSTHHHHCKPLLTGWIVGANDHQQQQTPPLLQMWAGWWWGVLCWATMMITPSLIPDASGGFYS